MKTNYGLIEQPGCRRAPPARVRQLDSASRERIHHEKKLASAIDLFPAKTSLEIIAFAFTSMSAVIGQKKGVVLIDRARPSVVSTNPATAAKTVMNKLDVR